jgi:hypothetical protein
MAFPETIRDTIVLMRRRVLEIDGLIERIERQRTSVLELRKKDSPQSRQPFGKIRRTGT